VTYNINDNRILKTRGTNKTSGSTLEILIYCLHYFTKQNENFTETDNNQCSPVGKNYGSDRTDDLKPIHRLFYFFKQRNMLALLNTV